MAGEASGSLAPPTPQRRSLRRRVAFVSLTLLLAIGVLEMAARLTEGFSQVLPGEFDRGEYIEADVFSPGVELRHDGALTVVNEGLYIGPWVPPERGPEPRSLRVVVLGDSMSFGWGVRPELAWPAQLELRLRELGVDVEVLNFAVYGANTWLSLQRWRAHAADYKPDLVLLGWFTNDAAIDRGAPSVFRHCPEAGPPAQRRWNTAMERSALVRIAVDLRNIRETGSPLPSWDARTVLRADHYGFRCAVAWTGMLRDEVEATGADLAVVQIPELEDEIAGRVTSSPSWNWRPAVTGFAPRRTPSKVAPRKSISTLLPSGCLAWA